MLISECKVGDRVLIPVNNSGMMDDGGFPVRTVAATVLHLKDETFGFPVIGWRSGEEEIGITFPITSLQPKTHNEIAQTIPEFEQATYVAKDFKVELIKEKPKKTIKDCQVGDRISVSLGYNKPISATVIAHGEPTTIGWHPGEESSVPAWPYSKDGFDRGWYVQSEQEVELIPLEKETLTPKLISDCAIGERILVPWNGSTISSDTSLLAQGKTIPATVINNEECVIGWMPGETMDSIQMDLNARGYPFPGHTKGRFTWKTMKCLPAPVVAKPAPVVAKDEKKPLYLGDCKVGDQVLIPFTGVRIEHDPALALDYLQQGKSIPATVLRNEPGISLIIGWKSGEQTHDVTMPVAYSNFPEHVLACYTIAGVLCLPAPVEKKQMLSTDYKVGDRVLVPLNKEGNITENVALELAPEEKRSSRDLNEAFPIEKAQVGDRLIIPMDRAGRYFATAGYDQSESKTIIGTVVEKYNEDSWFIAFTEGEETTNPACDLHAQQEQQFPSLTRGAYFTPKGLMVRLAAPATPTPLTRPQETSTLEEIKVEQAKPDIAETTEPTISPEIFKEKKKLMQIKDAKVGDILNVGIDSCLCCFDYSANFNSKKVISVEVLSFHPQKGYLVSIPKENVGFGRFALDDKKHPKHQYGSYISKDIYCSLVSRNKKSNASFLFACIGAGITASHLLSVKAKAIKKTGEVIDCQG